VAADAAIAATKVQRRITPILAQGSGVTAADARQVAHVVYGATGTALAFRAGLVAACTGNATVKFDLLKNGVSILSAPVVVDSGDAARALVAGSIPSGDLVAGDVLEIDIDATAGTGALGTGAFAQIVLTEDPS
jgi:hypothetical protein